MFYTSHFRCRRTAVLQTEPYRSVSFHWKLSVDSRAWICTLNASHQWTVIPLYFLLESEYFCLKTKRKLTWIKSVKTWAFEERLTKFFKLVENEVTHILTDSCFKITRYKILFIWTLSTWLTFLWCLKEGRESGKYCKLQWKWSLSIIFHPRKYIYSDVRLTVFLYKPLVKA